jgi:hypothetical protein
MSRSVTTAGVLALALALAASTAALAQDGEPTTPVENPNTGEVSDTLIPQASAYETYAEHIRVLNDCDWLGLMAQYPEDAEIHLAGGTVVKGRQAIGDLFAGFVLERPDGNCGMTFTEESRLEVGNTENVQWVAEADFLQAPHRGSDAYVTDGQYMVAMVTTFGQPPESLVYNDTGDVAEDPAPDDPQGDGTEGATGDGSVDD